MPFFTAAGHDRITNVAAALARCSRPCLVEVAGRKFDTEEGFLVVTENPSDTLTRKNMLPVLRIRSASKNPNEPIFWPNGGPGQSNMSHSHLRGLLENHDFVLVGYRGVDGSIVLRSEEMEDAMQGVGANLLSDTSLHSLSRALDSFSRDLGARGIDISHYTMLDVISDLETARRAFKYEKVDLVGLSYGTRVALTYAYLHPDIVFRSAMIGVCPVAFCGTRRKLMSNSIIMTDCLRQIQTIMMVVHRHNRSGLRSPICLHGGRSSNLTRARSG